MQIVFGTALYSLMALKFISAIQTKIKIYKISIYFGEEQEFWLLAILVICTIVKER